jgi:hypothetical protein
MKSPEGGIDRGILSEPGHESCHHRGPVTTALVPAWVPASAGYVFGSVAAFGFSPGSGWLQLQPINMNQKSDYPTPGRDTSPAAPPDVPQQSRR